MKIIRKKKIKKLKPRAQHKGIQNHIKLLSFFLLFFLFLLTAEGYTEQFNNLNVLCTSGKVLNEIVIEEAVKKGNEELKKNNAVAGFYYGSSSSVPLFLLYGIKADPFISFQGNLSSYIFNLRAPPC
ncbi:MAG: hypothetical protein KKH98_11575 [Spirochaetes bacterium]|nr:hypothetical protein [Spirochaetota bacterium]